MKVKVKVKVKTDMKQSIDSGLSDDCFLSSSDASPQAERSSKEGHVWEEGRICLAKWSEDSVWYRARVMCRAAGSVVKVLFIDYGNEEEVDEKDIVKTLGDVPQNDYVDETAAELLTSQIKSSKSPDMESKKQDPSNFRSVWMEGDLCVAKWKDGVWYRARIERVLGEDCYRVFFLDYHNDATVIGTEILKDRAEVPLTFNLRIFWLLPQK